MDAPVVEDGRSWQSAPLVEDAAASHDPGGAEINAFADDREERTADQIGWKPDPLTTRLLAAEEEARRNAPNIPDGPVRETGVMQEEPPRSEFGAGFKQAIGGAIPPGLSIPAAQRFKESQARQKPAQGAAGFAGEVVGGAVALPSMVVPRNPADALAIVAGGPVGKAAQPIVERIAAAAGEKVARIVAHQITLGAVSGSMDAANAAGAIPPDQWAADPMGSLLTVTKAAGTGALKGAATGTVTGGVHALLPSEGAPRSTMPQERPAPESASTTTEAAETRPPPATPERLPEAAQERTTHEEGPQPSPIRDEGQEVPAGSWQAAPVIEENGPVHGGVQEPVADRPTARQSPAPRKGESIIIPKVVEEAGGIAARVGSASHAVAEGVVSGARWLTDSASKYMERLGEPGKKLAGDVRDIDRRAHKESATDRLSLRDVMGKMDRKARESVAKAINGRVPEIQQPEAMRAAAGKVRDILDRAMKAANSAGLKRTVAGHEVDIKGSGKAFPQVPNDAGRLVLEEAETRGLASPRVQRTIEKMAAVRGQPEGQSVPPDMQMAILADLKKLRDQQRRGVNPYFERSRIELPEDLVEWDPAKLLPHLLDRNWMLVEAVKKWDPDFKARDATIQEIGLEHGQHHATTIDNYLKASFGLTGQVDPAIDRAIRAVSNYESFSKMGYSPLSVFRNVGGRFSNLFGYDPAVQLKAAKDFPPFVNALFRESRKLGEAMEKTGAVRATSSLADIEIGAPGHGITSKGLELFKVAERGNQVHTAYAAGMQLVRDIDRIAKSEPLSPLGKMMDSLLSLTGWRDTQGGVARRIERHGIDGDRLADILADPNHRITPAELETAAYLAVNDTQFALSLATTPVWWSNRPFIRLMAKFKPWGVRQVQLIYNQVAKEAVKGNFAPLSRFLVAMTVTGEAYYMARDAVTGSQKSIASAAMSGEDDPKEYGKRLLGSFLAGGGLGFVSDLTYGISGWVGGPAVSTGKSAMEAVASIAQRPTWLQSQAAVRKFLRDEFAVSRQALPLIDRIDKAVFNKGNVAADYYRIRSKAFAFKESKSGGVGDSVKAMLVGKDFGVGKNSVPYDYAARNITVNDIDDASDYLASVLADAPDKGKAVQGIRQSLTAHSPLGSVPQQDRAAFLATLKPEDRAETIKLNTEWMARANKALAGAIRQMRGGQQ